MKISPMLSSFQEMKHSFIKSVMSLESRIITMLSMPECVVGEDDFPSLC